MRELEMSFGSNVKTLRTKKGLTQGELSDMANIELAQISRIERGATQPKLETIKKLCVALKCSADELIFDDDEVVLSTQARSVFEKVDKLSPMKKMKILDVVNDYCCFQNLNDQFKQHAISMNPDLKDQIESEYQRDVEMEEAEERAKIEIALSEEKRAADS